MEPQHEVLLGGFLGGVLLHETGGFLGCHVSILSSLHGVLHRGEKIIFSNELLFSTGEQHHEEPSIHGNTMMLSDHDTHRGGNHSLRITIQDEVPNLKHHHHPSPE